MKRIAWSVLFVVLVAGTAQAQIRQTVTESPHNLSLSGPNTPDACAYCHSSHNVAPVQGLWNHQLSSADSSYKFYSSSTYRQGGSLIGTDTSSRLCMSCHDGTVALGSTYNSAIPYPTGSSLKAATTDLGTDLRSDHPFAFDVWSKIAGLRDELFSSSPRRTANPKVTLPNGRIECTTCHDAHTPNIDPQRPTKFLVVSNANGELCLSCHTTEEVASNPLAGWTESAHVTTTSTENANVAGYGSVREGACATCHAPHNSGSARLLRSAEESTCFTCHANSNSSAKSAQVWVGHDDPSKFMHPVQLTGHDPLEDMRAGTATRHSECWDCHNSHAAKMGSQAIAPAVQPANTNVSGISKDGIAITAVNEYEICFKCHSEAPNRPQKLGYTAYGHTPIRDVDALNTRLDFNSTFSRHNVVQNRSEYSSASMRSAMLNLDGSSGRSIATGSLYCVDCHNGSAQVAGVLAPNGPHVSSFEHILERRYDMNRPAATVDSAVQSLSVPADGGDPLQGPFALCSKCHDLSRLLSPTGDLTFKYHNKHVVGMGISCAACHAPHGVQGSDASHHASLINLDTTIVLPDASSGTRMIDTGNKTCSVQCHFSNALTVTNHSGTSYK